MRSLLLLLCSTVLVLGMVRMANACKCAELPTATEAFKSADDIIIVKAILDEDADKRPYINRARTAKMLVEKVFKGKLKIKDEIIFGRGLGTDCFWTFKELAAGDRFLLYLNRPENRPNPFHTSKDPEIWFVPVCGRSRELAAAGDDLLYLQNLDKEQGGKLK
jgi:hypothetical protein